jgi:hypothetical protein
MPAVVTANAASKGEVSFRRGGLNYLYTPAAPAWDHTASLERGTGLEDIFTQNWLLNAYKAVSTVGRGSATVDPRVQGEG